MVDASCSALRLPAPSDQPAFMQRTRFSFSGLLRRPDGTLWRSALVAALFGITLACRVVAWVRSARLFSVHFFGLLALLAYVKYVQKAETQLPRMGTEKRRTGIRSRIGGRTWAITHYCLAWLSRLGLMTSDVGDAAFLNVCFSIFALRRPPTRKPKDEI